MLGEDAARLYYYRARRIFDTLTGLPGGTLRKLKSALTWRTKAAALERTPAGLRIHLGCGDKHFDGMLNCEFRPTRAADVVMDCGDVRRFRSDSATLIFSHAFFEHLYMRQQAPLIRGCRRVLKPGGLLVFIGLPDFEAISDAYLKKTQLDAATDGLAKHGDHFNLANVYRYTHGAPEIAPAYWLEQLHKSVFDKAFLRALLNTAGFEDVVLFNYRFPNESLPVCLGFAARKEGGPQTGALRDSLPEILAPFAEYIASTSELIIAE